MLLADAIDAFLTSCRADGLSEKTVKWYDSLLRGFLREFQAQELDSFTVNDLRMYIVKLRERIAYLDAPQKPASTHMMSRSSVDSHVTALHSFWAWCAREYAITNPMQNIRHPKPRQLEPRAITPQDFVKLFNACLTTVAGTRDRAILAFFADTGCRLAGLVGLKLSDLDIETGRAVVLEKGNKTRTVVFTRLTARFLTAWLNLRMSPSDYVFTSVVAPCNGLSSQGVEEILKRLKRRARITGRANPHSFRHAFAREYLRNGGDLVTLARLLGHADVNTTAKAYAIFSQDELAELHEKYSPLRGMMA